MTKEQIEEILTEYPVCQYGFLKTEEVVFSERIHQICKLECPRYNHSWSCPPATGSVEECRKRCSSFQNVLLFTTMAEVEDISSIEKTLDTRKGHEQIVQSIADKLRRESGEILVLSGESCQHCKKCSWPERACLHPEIMIPCIEGYGIVATECAEKCEIDFYSDFHTVTWFAMIFWEKAE